MIWHLCFISLAHLFEIQLFSSDIDHPKSYQYAYVSWTDNTHNRLIIQPNTSGIYIDRCYDKVEHLIAICLSTKRNFNQLYECHSAQQYHLQKRSKRKVDEKSKRSLYVFLLIVIGILSFLVGIIVGITVTVYVSIKRQQRREHPYQRYKTNKQLDPVIKSLNINNEISKRLMQNKISIKSPTVNLTSDHPSIRREQEIPDNAPLTLNRYKTLQDQSLKRERTIQRLPTSNSANTKSALILGNIFGNLSKTKISLK